MMTSSYIHCIDQCRACVGVHTQVEVECVVVRPYNDTSLIQLLLLRIYKQPRYIFRLYSGLMSFIILLIVFSESVREEHCFISFGMYIASVVLQLLVLITVAYVHTYDILTSRYISVYTHCTQKYDT
jgi:hypothetical protein